MLDKEIWKFGRNLPLATFGSERVNSTVSNLKLHFPTCCDPYVNEQLYTASL